VLIRWQAAKLQPVRACHFFYNLRINDQQQRVAPAPSRALRIPPGLLVVADLTFEL
jgi:hypothetical protein